MHGEGSIAAGGGVVSGELNDRGLAPEDDDQLAVLFGVNVEELFFLDDALEDLHRRAGARSGVRLPFGTRW